MNTKELLNILEKTGAILDGHFLLSSGLHSNIYIQCAKLLQHPKDAEKVGRALAEKFISSGLQQPDVIVSPALGGIIIGHEVARAINKSHIFVEKVNGKPTLRRGFTIESGTKFIVVEDVATTGKSIMEVVSLLRDLGGIPVAILTIIDRSDNNELPFGDIPFISLMKQTIETYKPDNCPLCKSGIPVTKPGSRIIKD
jgi:orotate phosphoribosyltransferase